MPIRTDKPQSSATRAEASEPDAAARDFANKAKAGSARLRLALLRYGARHGLPNLSRQQCAAALRLPSKTRTKRRAAAPAAAAQIGNQERAQGAATSREGRQDGTRG